MVAALTRLVIIHLNQVGVFTLAGARFLAIALLRRSHIAAALWSEVYCLAVSTAFPASRSLRERSLLRLNGLPIFSPCVHHH